MSSFVETKAMEQLTKSPMEFVEYPSTLPGPGAQVGPLTGRLAQTVPAPITLPAQRPGALAPGLGSRGGLGDCRA